MHMITDAHNLYNSANTDGGNQHKMFWYFHECAGGTHGEEGNWRSRASLAI